MDRQRFLELEAKCIQDHPPPCVATCPVHMDAKSFVAEMKAGNFDGAMNIFRKTVPFTGIIGRVCDHPCQAACKRREAGEAISLSALEKACVQMDSSPPLRIFVRPQKDKRVAVVGGGLSGLTAAFDLAQKGYGVVLFEEKNRLGGNLWKFAAEELPREVIAEDLAVLPGMGVEIRLGIAVGGGEAALSDLCRDFDAVFLGCGKCPPGAFGLVKGPEGQIDIDPVAFCTSRKGVFAGGSILAGGDYSPIGSLAGGRRAAISIDRYLQGVSLTAVRQNEGSYQTRLYTSLKGFTPLSAVIPADPAGKYTREEAMQEAGRCLQCACLECVKACVYLAYYQGYPKKYLRDINHNLVMVKGNHTANKMINSCSLCDLCQVVCPNGLNMGEVCREARESMVQRGKMPPSAHDFPLRDMEFSNSEKFALARHEPGKDASRFLFFPGCQLSASAPEYVEKIYAYLRAKLSGGVGLILRCCGAPARWAGQQGLFDGAMREIAGEWQDLGRPRFIAACSTCYQMLKNYFPAESVTSLWEIYDRMGLPEGSAEGDPCVVAVHDACTTREEKHIHESVRRILEKLNYSVQELENFGEETGCCGYGGLMCFANPELAVRVVERRVGESRLDYLTYCAMCRDRFAAQGKRTFHLLDLIHGVNKKELAGRKGPGYSQRHENRARLKNRMLREIWGEEMERAESFEAVELELSDEIKEIMEKRLILAEDIQKAIEHAESSGNKLYDEESGYFLAAFRPVSVTYWVVYSRREKKYVIHNAYSHRMQVSEVR